MPVTVKLIERTGRPFIEARWIDPVTGKKRTKSTGHKVKRDAERFAARLEDDLNGIGPAGATRSTWAAIRSSYEIEEFPSLAVKTRRKTATALDRFEAEINPHLGSAITTDVIREFRRRLQQPPEGRNSLSLFTVRGHLAELRKVLKWAHRQGLLSTMPHVEFPRCVGGMKGRPITAEEFERMIAVTPAVVGEPAAASWRHLLCGLWFSGLRLGEALSLDWLDDRHITLDWTGGRPSLRIQAHAQKSRKFQIAPLVDDFGDFLRNTPRHDRRGYVFRPCCLGGDGRSLRTVEWVGKIIGRIGAQAGVKVGPKKFASAHDFRRAFGFRWAQLVLPQHLQELMRHADIKTTMQFYVGANATATADAARAASKRAFGNTFGNSGRFHGDPLDSSEAEKAVS